MGSTGPAVLPGIPKQVAQQDDGMVFEDTVTVTIRCQPPGGLGQVLQKTV